MMLNNRCTSLTRKAKNKHPNTQSTQQHVSIGAHPRGENCDDEMQMFFKDKKGFLVDEHIQRSVS